MHIVYGQVQIIYTSSSISGWSSIFYTLVQVSLFLCGGVAVAIEVSHKIADGSSVACFSKTWAAISAGAQDFAQPVYIASSLLRPPTSPIKRVKQSGETALRSRRFVFNAAKLSDLKAKIHGENGVVDFNPSTVEAVSSLLFKCVVTASGPSAFLQMVNPAKENDSDVGRKQHREFCVAGYSFFRRKKACNGATRDRDRDKKRIVRVLSWLQR